MPTIVIAFDCNWDSPQNLLASLNYLSENENSRWKNVLAVSECSMAQYVVVLQACSAHSDGVPNSKKIYLQREPRAIVPPELVDKTGYAHVSLYSNGGFHAAIPWITSMSLPKQLALPVPPKSKSLVVVCSSKAYTEGQRQRLRFIEHLCQQSDLDIDVYGWNLVPERFFGHYKGATPGRDKFHVLAPYRYALALENSQEANYFTEKFVDCILAYCVPIYWGCPNMNRYFNPAVYRSVDINNLQQATQTVKDVVQQPVTCYQQLAEARQTILTKYNIWAVVHDIVNHVHRTAG